MSRITSASGGRSELEGGLQAGRDRAVAHPPAQLAAEILPESGDRALRIAGGFRPICHTCSPQAREAAGEAPAPARGNPPPGP
jgi:hypothetical protein